MAYQDLSRAGKWTPPKSKSSGPKTTTSNEAWKKANAGRANASNSPPNAPAKSTAPAKVSPRMGGASSPAKNTSPATQPKVSAASVTGRKPTGPAVKPAATVKAASYTGGATDKGDNTKTALTNTPGVKKSPASASKKASTTQPKNAPPIPVSKPNPDALGGSSAVSKTPDYAVKAIQARSGPGRTPTSSVKPAASKSVGFTNADATGGFGAKARPVNYSYMDREK